MSSLESAIIIFCLGMTMLNSCGIKREMRSANVKIDRLIEIMERK